MREKGGIIDSNSSFFEQEPIEKLVSNVQSFQQYLFSEDLDLPELRSLFNSKKYEEASKGVCGSDHPYFKRVQVNLILMLPGQDLPMHFDLPWFRNGANRCALWLMLCSTKLTQVFSYRFNLPQWLLLAMAGSKFWAQEQYPQVQGVAYIHSIEDVQGGNFFLYPQGPGGQEVSFESKANTGLVLDGIKVIHGVERFNPGYSAPDIDKGEHFLTYTGSNEAIIIFVSYKICLIRDFVKNYFQIWNLSNSSGAILRQYSSQDLRISLVWRSICFKTEHELAQFGDPQDAQLPPKFAEEVMQILVQNLQESEPENSVDLALLLLQNYVKYPMSSNAKFPLNFCALPELLARDSNLKLAVKFLLSSVC